jgi:hypothetical protein
MFAFPPNQLGYLLSQVGLLSENNWLVRADGRAAARQYSQAL